MTVCLMTQNICINADFSIRKIQALTSEKHGSGMDKPKAFLSFFGFHEGGTFSVDICDDERCCSTGILNTEDNNWERGKFDWFVGRQIQECDRFVIKDQTKVKLHLHHEGSNAGSLDYINIHSWHSASSFHCPINRRLDYKSSFTSNCTYEEHQEDQDEKEWCNGSKDFCNMRFDQFLFPGTHNSGTGEREGTLRCSFKNQDLNIREQLEFGIRFFDLDVIYSFGLSGCDGFEAGHGNSPELGIYQCYGLMANILDDLEDWLIEHRSEVVVINFGNIGFKDETIPVLVKAMKAKFDHETGPRLNTEYKVNGSWPTLGSAVDENTRLFVFIRGDVNEHQGLVEDIKTKPESIDKTEDKPGAVRILSSFKSGSVGTSCVFALRRADLTCSITQADFIKVSLFSSFGKAGVDCLWHMANICNKLVKPTIESCRNTFEASPKEEEDQIRFAPNFLLLDYPNYQGYEEKSFIILCNDENKRRAWMLNSASNVTNDLLDAAEDTTTTTPIAVTSSTTITPEFDPEQ